MEESYTPQRDMKEIYNQARLIRNHLQKLYNSNPKQYPSEKHAILRKINKYRDDLLIASTDVRPPALLGKIDSVHRTNLRLIGQLELAQTN